MNNKQVFLWVFISVLLAIFLSIAVFSVTYIKDESIKTAIKFAKNNILLRKIQPTGLFIYDFNLKDGAIVQDDNIVRQMGVMYVFGRLLEAGMMTNKDKREYKDSIKKILSNTHIIKRGDRDILLLDYYEENKLGSLSLLFNGMEFLSRHDKQFEKEYKLKYSQLLNTILWLQKKDGDFAQFISDQTKLDGKEHTSSSGYATGEVLVSLSLYLQRHPDDEKVQKTVLNTLSALENRGLDNQYKGLYLWLMTAGNLLYKNKNLPEALRQKAYFVAHKYHMAMRDRLVFVAPGYNTCAHTEGLAQYILMTKDKGLAQDEKKVYLNSISNNLKLQIIDKNKEDIMKKTKIQEKAYDNKYASGAFLDSVKKMGTRIDYTQHCISALLPYRKINK